MSSKATEPLVLIVDDDPPARYALSYILEREGCQVMEAGDGDAALSIAMKARLNLVLLDLMLPGMDGFSLLAKLRKNRRLREVPIIAVTGRTGSAERQTALDAGFNDHLTKPVDVESIKSVVRKWLKK